MSEHEVRNLPVEVAGQSIFEYKFNDKKLVERPLPPEMRGERIADGPLPFLFGPKADEMKARYWIRVITPEDAKKMDLPNLS